jgi:hypothetical protein
MLGLNFVFRKAQATVDNAMAKLVWTMLMVVPLFVAAGFGTAAASAYLHRIYEPEIADLIVAGAYAALAIAMAIAYALRVPETAVSEEAKAQEEVDTSPASTTSSMFGDAEREMVIAALTTAAPFALPRIMAAAFRNLPVLAVLGVVAFILSRGSTAQSMSQNDLGTVPAE